MNDRDEIISDQPFRSRLEYSATAWLATAADRNLRQFWKDGFIPEAMRNTNRGGDVEGTVWVGEGSSTQHQYRFVASVPQKLLHGRGLTKSAALEYASRGICINAVCPGTINTPMVADMLAKEPDAMKDILRDQPIGRLGQPEEIAAVVLWLCSPGASFVIGHALVVDGGYTAR